MRLTRYTDFAMRVLLYLAARPERLCPIAEIAASYAISQNHLMKVVNDLVNAGYLESVRGRSGGIRLARPADEINVGRLIRHTEEDFDLVECGACIIAPACGLTSILDEALVAFLDVLDSYSLADVLARKGDFTHLLHIWKRERTPTVGIAKPRREKPGSAIGETMPPDSDGYLEGEEQR
ncbi:Rrf2 family transcriptional regulator [Croceicoccus sp. F390]|uniref:Rrf2 family transcriptional regulator n=1 Tax=Croceicoccus esteveae TaxID=3075597 RepID=A0ABU2ZGZ1_9SPHN|nr:Rrf2 family transcriptional regulator [Croceicoccus sp. F390]MDT0575857.1 Rrf2 family transcriptional regulator [Croceicoccus sp. F390]